MGGLKWFVANTFLGYSKNDFKWKGEKGLSSTKSGNEAYVFFKEELLKYYLVTETDSIDERIVSERMDHLADLIKKAMKEN